MAATLNSDSFDSYKYQWARYLSRKSLDYDIQVVKRKLAEQQRLSDPAAGPDGLLGMLPSVQPGQTLGQIAQGQQLAFGSRPKEDGKFKVGIVGAGVSGLFTALLIDWLNKESDGKLKIEYDILEAAGPERVGGRLYTHYFPAKGNEKRDHDYYDVGAMRFPKNQVMERTFRLFNFLDIKEGVGKGKLRQYYLYDNLEGKGVCPSYYNDVRKVGPYAQYNANKEADPFGVNNWVEGDDEQAWDRRIPEELIIQDPTELVSQAIDRFTRGLRRDMDKTRVKNPSTMTPASNDYAGWNKLMRADYMSTRQFLREKAGEDGEGYNFNTIEWMETFGLATGWYNQSLAETVLEELDFAKPNGVEKPSNEYWWCIDGGTQQVAYKMVDRLAGKKPECYRQVTAIVNDRASGDIKLTIKHSEPLPESKQETEKKKSVVEERSYFTVFNSTTLGALQRMNLTKADLNYGTKQAIRSLNYGASCKVGMKFKTGWWMKKPFNIRKGALSKTDLPLRVCVYPSYNVDDPDDEPMVLLCSYSWGQDAQRLGGLISPQSPKNEEELKELMLDNLARMHAVPEKPYDELLKQLHDEYMDHYAYDWYHDPNMLGAFGYFGPGQFSQMWPEIIKPSGWLFLIGEAASAHHGWICGAIESSVRAVFQLLETLQLQGQVDPRWKFTGYEEAMERLVGPQDITEHDVPFVGLPREIPHRQKGTKKDAPLQDTPLSDAVDLTFTAAQVIISFYELLLDIAAEAGKAAEAGH